MKSLVICEKGSQRANIVAAIGDRFGQVLAASGHLFTLAMPEEYSEAWADWRGFHVYRPPGDAWKLVPTVDPDEGRAKIAQVARQAIERALPSARRVYIATDADREGEVIGRELLDVYGFKGETFRVLFASEDPETIRDAFTAAIPIADREAIYQAGLARARADFIWNFSLTRAVTSALVQPGAKAVVGVGRVKTPTLAIVCRREIQIQQHKTNEAQAVRLVLETAAGTVTLTSDKDAPFTDKAEAQAFAASLVGQSFDLTADVSKLRTGPPKPPDLGVLQALGGRWGWSAEKVLDAGQQLYSGHRIMTYVRAATRYYPEAMIAAVPAILDALRAVAAYAPMVPAEPVIRRGAGGAFSDAGLAGESHHALAPNPKAAVLADLPAVLPALSAEERRLFDAVVTLFLQALSPDYEGERVAYSIEAGRKFAGSATRTLVPGWRGLGEADEADEAEQDAVAERFAAPGRYTVTSAEAFTRKAAPPKRYNQGSLVSAMINAWQFVPEPERRARLKEAKGIGTIATRAEVIAGLLDQAQLAESANKLAPTKSGMELFAILYRIDPRLVDPGNTADWESKIDEIARGTLAPGAFLDEIEAETRRLVEVIRQQKPSALFGTPAAPSSAQLKAVTAVMKATGKMPPADYRTNAGSAAAFLDQYGAKNARK